ncbi:hypothetical protein [Crateriforma spongiae]|uniref:hypothetical protein n=1 Tax=Crateriforma spongiae TaxID=2724528 RepID=UPI00197E9434|nr:hypothetical protein [Crateriforma spongiae]
MIPILNEVQHCPESCFIHDHLAKTTAIDGKSDIITPRDRWFLGGSVTASDALTFRIIRRYA